MESSFESIHDKLLSAAKFIRRVLQHTVLDSFHRIRHIGFLANRHSTARLALCRALLAAPPPPDPTPTRRWRDRLRELTGNDIEVCPDCGGPMLRQNGSVPKRGDTIPIGVIGGRFSWRVETTFQDVRTHPGAETQVGSGDSACHGHDCLARRMTAAGIGYTMADNAFVKIDDWERARQPTYALSPDLSHRVLEHYAGAGHQRLRTRGQRIAARVAKSTRQTRRLRDLGLIKRATDWNVPLLSDQSRTCRNRRGRTPHRGHDHSGNDLKEFFSADSVKSQAIRD